MSIPTTLEGSKYSKVEEETMSVLLAKSDDTFSTREDKSLDLLSSIVEEGGEELLNPYSDK